MVEDYSSPININTLTEKHVSAHASHGDCCKYSAAKSMVKEINSGKMHRGQFSNNTDSIGYNLMLIVYRCLC